MTPCKGIILCGHGSRDPVWRQPMEAVVARLAAAYPDRPVICAYLELQQPDLAAAAAQLAAAGAGQITVVPMFLGAGKHAREDLPRQLDRLRQCHGGVEFRLQVSVGEDPRVLDLLARIAAE